MCLSESSQSLTRPLAMYYHALPLHRTPPRDEGCLKVFLSQFPIWRSLISLNHSTPFVLLRDTKLGREMGHEALFEVVGSHRVPPDSYLMRKYHVGCHRQTNQHGNLLPDHLSGLRFKHYCDQEIPLKCQNCRYSRNSAPSRRSSAFLWPPARASLERQRPGPSNGSHLSNLLEQRHVLLFKLFIRNWHGADCHDRLPVLVHLHQTIA